MPLRDHFHPPLDNTHSWDEVHGGWPMEIVRHLLLLLPEGFRAAPRVHLGCSFDVVYATDEPRKRGTGVVSPTLSIEADLADEDEYEVRVYDMELGRKLVAVIELVSPANKDRRESRDKFVTKCAALLLQDVCVSIVDLVTNRTANLYAELLGHFGKRDPNPEANSTSIYAVSLRGRKPSERRSYLDAWYYPMTVGEPLPTLPIWLGPDQHIMLPLETSYQETCRVLSIA